MLRLLNYLLQVCLNSLGSFVLKGPQCHSLASILTRSKLEAPVSISNHSYPNHISNAYCQGRKPEKSCHTSTKRCICCRASR